ncbi:hypothetical protein [Cyclobacterium xiamenense]|uniref:hypothetical protein n=1 Tax=Cyclobacterium xiamenense TaxID=1297121 RepID=UPI0035CF72C3
MDQLGFSKCGRNENWQAKWGLMHRVRVRVGQLLVEQARSGWFKPESEQVMTAKKKIVPRNG